MGMRNFLLLIVSLLVSSLATAQSFRVSVSCDGLSKKNVSLLIFDEGATPRKVKPKATASGVVFTGSVAAPVYAELRHSDVSRPLEFFIENSEIRISFEQSNPNASAVNGSRVNSQMRYLLEQCVESDLTTCLSQFVTDNPSSPFASYILNRHLSQILDVAELDSLFRRLKPSPKPDYHYQLLASRLSVLSNLAEGCRLPNLLFTVDGRQLHTDSVWVDSCWHLLLVGASWCRQCAEIGQSLERDFPSVQTLVINVDNEKLGWDSPFMQQLDVDHIPYLILTDDKCRIVKRDLRIWELQRLIVGSTNNQ